MQVFKHWHHNVGSYSLLLICHRLWTWRLMRAEKSKFTNIFKTPTCLKSFWKFWNCGRFHCSQDLEALSGAKVPHCPRVVSTRQVRHSKFFSIFGRLWPRQECPCWPTNFKGGQFLSTNFTFVTWLYITKYFKMHHGIMPRPCLIMFLSKCDQEKHFHVACLGWEVGIFCPLSPLLLRYNISLSWRKKLPELYHTCLESWFWSNVTKILTTGLFLTYLDAG